MKGLDIKGLLESRMGDKGAPPEDAPPEGGGDPLMDAMQDFLSAMEAKDPQGMADAFSTAFKACEMEPHMEAGEPGPEGQG